MNVKGKVEKDVPGGGSLMSKVLEAKCPAVRVEGMNLERGSKWPDPEGGGPLSPAG